MANPQIENGHTQVANEILEALCSSRLNGTEWAVVAHIIRKTYGFKKKFDQISITQFEKALPQTRRAILKAISKLRLVNIITLVNKGSSVKISNSYSLQKDHEKWRLVNKSTLVNKKVKTSEQKGIQLVNDCIPTKETITKETIQKKALPRKTLKESFGEDKLVKLAEGERKKLACKYGRRNVDKFIDTLNNYIAQFGKDKYTSHYHTLLNWIRREKEAGKLKVSWADFNEEDFDKPEEYQKIINKYS